MAYLPRFDAPGVVQHIWASGTGPCAIFLDEDDWLSFSETSATAFVRLGTVCLQYCLMTTHYHFLLRTPEPVLSKTMQRVNGQYARTFNARHGRRGALFGRRFGSRFVQTQEDLLGVVRYIALNPLDVPGCTHPASWPWSSYANTIADRQDPLADTAELLRHAGGAARLRAFVERGLVELAA